MLYNIYTLPTQHCTETAAAAAAAAAAGGGGGGGGLKNG
jgi:hypothetical protein